MKTMANMKKWILACLATAACLSTSQAFALVAAKYESVNEIEAAIDAAAQSSKMAVSEFIVSARRLTPTLYTPGEVRYAVDSCVMNKNNKCKKLNRYIVTLTLTPSEGLGGGYQITVDSVKKIQKNGKSRESSR